MWHNYVVELCEFHRFIQEKGFLPFHQVQGGPSEKIILTEVNKRGVLSKGNFKMEN